MFDFRKGIVKERKHSPLRDRLMPEEGVKIDSRQPSRCKSAKGINTDLSSNHEKNPIHLIAMEYFEVFEKQGDEITASVATT